MTTEASTLACVIDGVALPEEDAKALWKEFSEHMDEKRGDFAGYAKKKDWFSVLPEYRGGKAVLVIRTTAKARSLPPVQAPQKPAPQKPRAHQPKPMPKARQKSKPPGDPKAPQRPAPPAKPRAQGGQAPPKKRSI
jgi:hypothetical protein